MDKDISNFIPIGNRLLLKRKAEEKRKDGLIIPDSAKKGNEEFEVVAIGDQVKTSFSLSDVVFLERYAGQEINLYGDEYTIVKDDQILAIIKE
jgi:chaperonin GroES